MTVRVTRGRALWVGAVAGAMVAAPMAAAAAPLPTAPSSPAGPEDHYIVQVAGDPIASYDGGSGLERTQPKKGSKVDRNSRAAKAYGKHLKGKQEKVLKSVGASSSKVTHDYQMSFNGFAATLTAQQAAALKKSPNVLRVWKDEILHADTTTTPKFLGMEGERGVWQDQFGGLKNAGRGMIVGVIDSGIWPEHPSFKATAQTKKEAQTIADKWNGTCQAGVEAPTVKCNNKLIGARYFDQGATVIPQEFRSPRDYGGHGTHTASTAAGNHGVKAEIFGEKVGQISGMAPRARIAAYKALWEKADGSGSSGSTSNLVAAIDAAVGDGVDVINYSISGSRDSVVRPDELAFLAAADAGVFVATSAGNSGDSVGTSSVAHNSPWTTTVASSTHDRGAAKTVTLGNGETYEGVGVLGGVEKKPLVNSSDAAASEAPTVAARRCYSDADNNPDNGVEPALDPAKVKGKIVVCERGENARTDKSDAVKAAGGAGMVLVNTSATQSLDADYHVVASIHVDATAGAAITKYADTDSATASISGSDGASVRAPEMSGFSSYGPAIAGGGDLLKPDITAPGSAVLAGVAPPGNKDQLFASYSGTSMSTPHIAGIAALIKQTYPTWSPAAVKSAMMTTATTKDNRDKPIQRAGKDATPLDYGAGHVRPAEAFNPGLVYDADHSDWLKYACGVGQLQDAADEKTCDVVGSIDPSDLNYPSIAVGDLIVSQTIKRTVTNVESKATKYTADVEAPPGFKATVTPRTITVPPGQSRSFEVILERTDATVDQWHFGSLTWSGKRGQAVRSPIAVRPLSVKQPEVVSGVGTKGSTKVELETGYSGTLNTSVTGLVPSKVTTKDVTSDTNVLFTVKVPEGTEFVRFATYDEDYEQGTDLDFVVSYDGDEIAESTTSTAEEEVTLQDPDPGTYTVEVDNFDGASSIPVKLNSFLLTDKAAGNLRVDPESRTVSAAEPFEITASWSGLTAGKRYLGQLHYDDGSGELDKASWVEVTS